jgi:O-antigen ligase
MVVIPILLAFSFRQRQLLARIGLWGVLALLVLALGRTMALGAWLGLSLVLLSVMLVGDTTVRRTGLMLLAVTLLTFSWFTHYGDVLQDALSAKFGLKRAGRLPTASMFDIGTSDRWMMWQAAWRMIQDRPVLGHGLNTFMANYLAYRVGGQAQPRYAHNCYLQVAAETGMVGLVLFAGLLWAFFAQLVAGLRRSHTRSETILLGLFAGLLAFAAQAGIDTNFYALRQAALFWTLAGLALGLSVKSVQAE